MSDSHWKKLSFLISHWHKALKDTIFIFLENSLQNMLANVLDLPLSCAMWRMWRTLQKAKRWKYAKLLRAQYFHTMVTFDPPTAPQERDSDCAVWQYSCVFYAFSPYDKKQWTRVPEITCNVQWEHRGCLRISSTCNTFGSERVFSMNDGTLRQITNGLTKLIIQPIDLKYV